MTSIAEPIEHEGQDIPVCKHCHVGIHRVPVGQGPPWVHDSHDGIPGGYRACSRHALANVHPDENAWPGDDAWPGDEPGDEFPEALTFDATDLGYELHHDK